MKHYHAASIEKKWQNYWQQHKTFATPTDTKKPKYYVLDMFPYPSGEGLHVGHPLGYIASDIIARYKRSQGYAVLHPIGFDAFGLPAEQYALQTGQHPAVTTQQNRQRYTQQLQQLGLSYDWERVVNTSDPYYYKWTQWMFLKFFNSWYDTALQKARPIVELINIFEKSGNQELTAYHDEEIPCFTAQAWKAMTVAQQQQICLAYRLAFLEETTVNWCPELGTVLANEEVKDGLSERGGFPVIKKKMKQWSLRIKAYAERLLAGLEPLDWPSSTKEMQKNWIGKSVGANVTFAIVSPPVNSPNKNLDQPVLEVFTTRPDTIFGVTYLALAPEHPLAGNIAAPNQQKAVANYIANAVNRSERERLADAAHPTGIATGSYAVHPFTHERIPIWIADYVLVNYGTGAVMGVPAHDSRDYNFAKYFQLPIRQVIEAADITCAAHTAKTGKIINSGFLTGKTIAVAQQLAIDKLVELGKGCEKTCYRLRNAIFSRQRYWGEPFPIYYKDGFPYGLPEEDLPLELPDLASYQPTNDGEPPLGRALDWKSKAGYPLEINTMPSWAGSSWYFFRYMDPQNNNAFVSAEAQKFWQSVDLYIGGSEHTTGHLLYARFWTMCLHDLGYVAVEEPFQKLIHQGMIQYPAYFVYRIKGSQQFVSYHLRNQYETVPMRVASSLVIDDTLQVEAFRNWRSDLSTATFILENGKYICGKEMEKMSKSKHNTVDPAGVIEKYGADALRLYTMFLGPIEQNKPWDTNGIEGVHRFLMKTWRLFYPNDKIALTDDLPSDAMQRAIHRLIKTVQEAIEQFSFNTAVSHLMICVNELTALKCANRSVLTKLLLVLAPFAPHLAEELWQALGYAVSITNVPFPTYDPKYLQSDLFEYPIAINGKVRSKMVLKTAWKQAEEAIIKRQVLQAESIQKWLSGQQVKKVILIPGRMINVVV